MSEYLCTRSKTNNEIGTKYDDSYNGLKAPDVHETSIPVRFMGLVLSLQSKLHFYNGRLEYYWPRV